MTLTHDLLEELNQFATPGRRVQFHPHYRNGNLIWKD